MVAVYFLFLMAAELVSTEAMTGSVTVREYRAHADRGHTAYRAKKWDKAFDHLSQAARWGHTRSQFLLGMLILEGHAREGESHWGYAWLLVSNHSKNPNWKAEVDKLTAAAPDAWRETGQALAKRLDDLYGADAYGIECKQSKGTGTHLRYQTCSRPNRKNRPTFPTYESMPL